MQQQGGGRGSQFGAPPPEMAPFPSSSGTSPRGPHMLGNPAAEHHSNPLLPEAASPISSRPPPVLSQHQSFDEMVPVEAGSFPDEGGAPGNRWPRQETISLLKIRSEMDAAFRDATLKGHLWEDVSRKLAELGYTRSAKKCKEKFENVHKYYKRTKEGRAGRQDGKSYRFFTQLEALNSPATTTSTSAAMSNPVHLLAAAAIPSTTPTTSLAASGLNVAGPSSSAARIQTVVQPSPFTPPRPAPDTAPTPVAAPPGISGCLAAAGISFSSDTFSTSSYDSDDDGTQEGTATGTEGRKRKRGGGSGCSQKMMAFFEGMMKQVMERQEAMQQRFLDTMDKREQDRAIREEAWKRQEMSRLNREHELLAQERAMAASRDAAIISFLQKMNGGQAIQLPPALFIPAAPPPPAAPNPAPTQTPQLPQLKTELPHPKPQPPSLSLPLPLPLPLPPQQQQPQQKELPLQQQQHQTTEIVHQQQQTPPTTQPAAAPPVLSTALVPVTEPHEIVGGGATFEGTFVSSSRWPKSEVHALIKLRSGLESRYQDAGPKGPLWEEISAGMLRMGYHRNPKRCKEKWENINKYFKKVKESNKKRPEDAKTCPYFHQLDALYRKKAAGIGGSSFGNPRPQELEVIPNTIHSTAAPPPPPHSPPQQQEIESKKDTSNGGLPPSFLEQGTSVGRGTTTVKKPEDIMKELMEQQQQASMDDYDSDNNLDQDEDDEEDEDGKMQYEIQFQRRNVSDGSVGRAAANAKAAGSFLAMVQ